MSQLTADPTTPLRFDPYEHALQDDPYPVYARLRRESPLHHNDEHDFWVLSRYHDIQNALRSDQVYSNSMGVSLDASSWNRHAHLVMSFLAMDEPRHMHLRRLVSRGFTPKRINALAPRIQELTESYLDSVLDERELTSFDWIGEFAGRLPMDVISDMLGVPESDRAEVRRLADLLVQREDGLRDVPPVGIDASMQLFEYYRGLVAARRARPDDDLITALIEAEVDGVRMSDDEILGFCFLLIVAGNETTTKLLGNSLYQISAHPAAREQVFNDPDLVHGWVEETLRYDPSTQMVARLLLQDVTIEGVTAPAGAKMLFLLASANRDETVFGEPDAYRIDRGDDEWQQILSFGGGLHFCLGASLARLEARIALAELVRRVRTVEVDRDACVRFYSANVRGFHHVPVTVVKR